ncbi:hypothetical protein RHA1_ro08346 (plasmid) [Rhodococcus jostii RHA1]|uniref:Uncharacterized protein n=1 Tax=Rhodococcus jostii (strain RHA1) TaxID=101510 RepID=Q0RZ96_RHOJR|nr:hypothetical protein RHA1_ro08346 [Rhodococcus jostii RHA1]
MHQLTGFARCRLVHLSLPSRAARRTRFRPHRPAPPTRRVRNVTAPTADPANPCSECRIRPGRTAIDWQTVTIGRAGRAVPTR